MASYIYGMPSGAPGQPSLTRRHTLFAGGNHALPGRQNGALGQHALPGRKRRARRSRPTGEAERRAGLDPAYGGQALTAAVPALNSQPSTLNFLIKSSVSGSYSCR